MASCESSIVHQLVGKWVDDEAGQEAGNSWLPLANETSIYPFVTVRGQTAS